MATNVNDDYEKIKDILKYRLESLNWNEINEKLDSDNCREIYLKAIGKYFESKTTETSKLIELFNENYNIETIKFDFYMANFTNVCKFCCKLKSDTIKMQNICHDEPETELINKLNYTIYETLFKNEQDYKLINLICRDCRNKVEEFYEFKKSCENNFILLNKVKEKMEKLDTHSQDLQEETKNETDFAIFAINEFDDENVETVLLTNDDQFNDECTESSESAEKKTNEKQKHPTKKLGQTKKQKNNEGKVCAICGKLVKGIQMHLLTHTRVKKFKCEYCQKSFIQSGQLKRHINSHLDIRNYSCPYPQCGRKFVDPSSVTKHLVVHNKDDRKFVCSICGSLFNRLGALRYHEKTHSNIRNHKCSMCEKSFLAKYDLTKHYRSHTGERPYSCQFCNKTFSISKNAKVHIRAVHSKEKPYQCTFCSLAFSYRSSLKQHLLKIHQTDTNIVPKQTESIDNHEIVEEEHYLIT